MISQARNILLVMLSISLPMIYHGFVPRLSWRKTNNVLFDDRLTSAASAVDETLENRGQKVGIIIVDHGSKKDEANKFLDTVVARYKELSSEPIVEAAHMELAEPSITTALQRCVAQGATRVVVHPYFLSRGRHVQEDIPMLVAAAASEHGGLDYVITEPLGCNDAIIHIVDKCIGDAKNAVR